MYNTKDLVVEVPCFGNLLREVLEKAKAEYKELKPWGAADSCVSLSVDNAVKLINYVKSHTDLETFGYCLSETELKAVSDWSARIYRTLKDRSIYV